MGQRRGQRRSEFQFAIGRGEVSAGDFALRRGGDLGVRHDLGRARAAECEELVVGEDAAEAAATLVTAIKEFPNLADRMDVAYRVGGRRWDVKFKGRTDVVAFPDDARLMEQLDALNLMQAQNRVLDLPATRIDARHPKYIALQPMPGAPADASSPGGT